MDAGVYAVVDEQVIVKHAVVGATLGDESDARHSDYYVAVYPGPESFVDRDAYQPLVEPVVPDDVVRPCLRYCDALVV